MATVSEEPGPHHLDANILFGRHDLPRLIEVVIEVEISFSQQAQAHARRKRSERERADASTWWEQTRELVVRTGEARWWDWRILWLQDIRIYLGRELERYATAGTSAR